MSNGNSDFLRAQERLAAAVKLSPLSDLPALVIGVDAAYIDRSGASDAIGVGAAVVIDTATFDVVEKTTIAVEVAVDYQPGLLAFREAPVLLAAIAKLETKPELIVCDGHGIAHPRRSGLACHIGVTLGVPTIGCAKQPMVGQHKPVDNQRGSYEPIITEDGQTVGAAVRTATDVKLVYVSPGHLVDVESSVQHILGLTPKFRLPETTRAADHLARQAAAELHP